ncbi:MAG: PIN domain-containing protein [Methanosarcinales archaeon]
MRENGKLMLDTNAVIAYREGILEVCTLIEGAEMLFLPVIVLGELLYGALNSAQPEKNKQDIYKFLEYSVLVPIDEAIAVRYSTIYLLKEPATLFQRMIYGLQQWQ